ncbi:MAG: hypothetical protein HYV13_01730 [Candidatus Doudnabacteria bacterium]|nr:hypothetical protein [Candidatus Doudnabacteria bacterium]
MRKLRKRPTIVVIRVARNRIKLDELASMLIQLDNIQVVLEERTVNAFVEGGSHYRILASKIGSWKVGDWFFNLQGMAKTTGLQLAVGE